MWILAIQLHTKLHNSVGYTNQKMHHFTIRYLHLPNLRSVALKYLVAVQTSELLRGFVWEKVAGWRGLPSIQIIFL